MTFWELTCTDFEVYRQKSASGHDQKPDDDYIYIYNLLQMMIYEKRNRMHEESLDRVEMKN